MRHSWVRQAIPSKSVQASIGQPVKDATVSARTFRPSWPFTPLPRFSCLLPHHPWRFSLFADRVRDVARRQKGRAVRFLERLVVLLVTVMEALTRGWKLIDLTLCY